MKEYRIRKIKAPNYSCDTAINYLVERKVNLFIFSFWAEVLTFRKEEDAHEFIKEISDPIIKPKL